MPSWTNSAKPTQPHSTAQSAVRAQGAYVHGASLHGVLVLPAVAWLLSFTGWDEARRTRVVALAATGYGLAIAAALAYSLLH